MCQTYGNHVELSNSIFLDSQGKWNTVFFDKHPPDVLDGLELSFGVNSCIIYSNTKFKRKPKRFSLENHSSECR